MNILFEEHAAAQRAGGIEAATAGLVAALVGQGMTVTRRLPEGPDATDTTPDCVHIHGIWSPTLMRRLTHWRKRGIPCVVTVHGMLEPWALAHKKLKKQVAWQLYQKRLLNRASALHATSEREAENLKKLGLNVPIAMIPWGVEGPRIVSESRKVESQTAEEPRAVDGPHALVSSLASPDIGPSDIGPSTSFTALFVGRIFPVKGLPMLVEAWARLRPEGWKMKIVGPDEGGHLAELKELCEKLGLEWEDVEGQKVESQRSDNEEVNIERRSEENGISLASTLTERRYKSDLCPPTSDHSSTILFCGPLNGTELAKAYQTADLFILPSHTENFSMVVAEAMAHGLPVITTHGAPWKLLEEENCGWWVPVSVDGIAGALEDATQRSPEELTAMGARGRKNVEERFAWEGIARQMSECYEWLLGEGPKPDCVLR